VQCILQVCGNARCQQGFRRLTACSQYVSIAQWPLDPATQHPAAHGRAASIHDAGERVFVMPGQALLELEIASRWTVHDDGVVAFLDGDRLQMWQRRFLCVIDILQQRAGSGHPARHVVAAES
jgi:hypothetical protein